MILSRMNREMSGIQGDFQKPHFSPFRVSPDNESFGKVILGSRPNRQGCGESSMLVRYFPIFETSTNCGVLRPHNCRRMSCAVRAMLYPRFASRIQARLRA